MTKTESSSKKTSLFNGYELILGKQEDVRQWKAFILKLNTLKGTELSRYLMQRLNIDNYLRWLTGAVCTVNYDGFDQNYAVYLPQSERKKLTSRLLAYSVFRKLYKSLIGAMVMKHFTVAKLDRDLQRMFKRIAPYIYNDSMRKWSPALFEGEPQFILSYVRERRAIIKEALKRL